MPDVVSLIESDHRAVEELFAKFRQDQDPQLATQICDELTKHTAGEEEAVYPVIEREVPGGADMTKEALNEHAEAKQLIERVRSASESELNGVMSQLQQAVEHHVREEEQEVLPKTRQALDASRLQEMGEAFEQAKRAAG
jgi:hemerythrin superfamily protein